MSSRQVPGKFRGIERMNRAAVMTMDHTTLTDRVCGVLKLVYDRDRLSRKELGRIADASSRSVENWLRGDNLPDGYHMLRLMAHFPEFAGEVRRLTAMEANHDPEFLRDFQRAMQTFQRSQEIARAAAVLDDGDAFRRGDAASAQPARDPSSRRRGPLDGPAVGLDDEAA